MILIGAITLGFLGSIHCIGMCGPIAMAIPVKSRSWFDIVTGALVYNTGRVFTYGAMGIIFGMLGRGFKIAGLQSMLSLILGMLILISVLVPGILTFHKPVSHFIKYVTALKCMLRTLFNKHSFQSLFAIGLLNGLLPCGLVYIGIAGAIATGETSRGMLFMIFFGLGTLPAMLLTSFAGKFISVEYTRKIRSLVPVFVSVMAVLLILRGLHLNIPFLSPPPDNAVCHMCVNPGSHN